MTRDEMLTKLNQLVKEYKESIGCDSNYLMLDENLDVVLAKLNQNCAAALSTPCYGGVDAALPKTKYLFHLNNDRCKREASVAFYHWMINDSMFSDIMLKMTGEEAVELGGVLIDIQGIANVKTGLAIKAARHPTEHGRDVDNMLLISNELDIPFELAVFFVFEWNGDHLQEIYSRSTGHSFLSNCDFAESECMVLGKLNDKPDNRKDMAAMKGFIGTQTRQALFVRPEIGVEDSIAKFQEKGKPIGKCPFSGRDLYGNKSYKLKPALEGLIAWHKIVTSQRGT